MNLYRFCFIMLVHTFLTTCSAVPEASGVCSLDCSGPKVSGIENEMSFLGFAESPSVTLHCQGLADGSKYPSVVPIKFLIQRKGKKLTSAIDATTTTTTTQPSIPISGVGFEATILSGSTSDNNPSDSSSKYKGIMTSQAEWCTDSCGVGSIDIQPQCRTTAHTIMVQISAGSVSKIFQISVEPN